MTFSFREGLKPRSRIGVNRGLARHPCIGVIGSGLGMDVRTVGPGVVTIGASAI